MKSKKAIQIEFQQVTQQAKQLDQCATELHSIRSQLAGLVDNLRGGWAGESAELYFQKCEELSSKLFSSQQSLTQIASVIQRSAKAYRDAELAAIQMVQD